MGAKEARAGEEVGKDASRAVHPVVCADGMLIVGRLMGVIGTCQGRGRGSAWRRCQVPPAACCPSIQQVVRRGLCSGCPADDR
jgi:hypothetical protein